MHNEHDLLLLVYQIPGGNVASQQVYDQIVHLLEREPDLALTVFRGFLKYDGTGIIILIGPLASFTQYAAPLGQYLATAQAQLLHVPEHLLAPYITRFFERQEEMQKKNLSFFKIHYQLPDSSRQKHQPRSCQGGKE